MITSEKPMVPARFSGEPSLYKIVKERLSGTNTDLTDFLFHNGGNIYVFSYQKEGGKRHTLIDTGDSEYRNQILPTLAGNDISPTSIERIIITHRHPDHCGLAALLAKESKAKILVHSNFRSFVEGEISQEERIRLRLGDLDPSQLKECDIEYLSQSNKGEPISIGGADFLSLVEPIEIGEGGKLLVLASPESTSTHSPDQIIVLYSPRSHPQKYERRYENFCPTDDILFSGDLWLMTGPRYEGEIGGFSRHFTHAFHRIKGLVSDEGTHWPDPREQDSEAKEALKRGFCLIRVKPGHGEEFIGSRILPNSLLAARDTLVQLGYPLDADISVLRSGDTVPKIATIMEQAYTSFVNELLLWIELGYSLSQISELLVRIYKEQIGGGPLVEKDRKQRRERLKATLARLRDDEAEPDELHRLAESTLSELRRVR